MNESQKEQEQFDEGYRREYMGEWVPVPPVSAARPEIKAKRALVDVKWTGNAEVTYELQHGDSTIPSVSELAEVARFLRDKWEPSHAMHGAPDCAGDGEGGLHVFCCQRKIVARRDVVQDLLRQIRRGPQQPDWEGPNDFLIRAARDHFYPAHRGHSVSWTCVGDQYDVECGCGVGFHTHASVLRNVANGRSPAALPPTPTEDDEPEVGGPREKWIARKARAAGKRDATRASMVAELELKGEVESLRRQLEESRRQDARRAHERHAEPIRSVEVDDLRAKLKDAAAELNLAKERAFKAEAERDVEAATVEALKSAAREVEKRFAAELEARGLATYGYCTVEGCSCVKPHREPTLQERAARVLSEADRPFFASDAVVNTPAYHHPRGVRALPAMRGGSIKVPRPAVFYCQNEED